MDEKKRSKLLRKAEKELKKEIMKKYSKTKYQCGSCEKEFSKLKNESCPYCGSGNWVRGNIDD